MNYNQILIRFGELNTKGKNKRDFINTLYSNIKFRLKKFTMIQYIKAHDRIYLELEQCSKEDQDSIMKIVAEIPGISSFSFVHKCPSDIEQIIADSFQLVTEEKGSSFKVKTRRADKRFNHHSDEVNRLVANYILKNTSLKVDIHQPDITVNIEIRNEGTFIFVRNYKGAGGYPLGVGGKALALISGGIDSPVAIHAMMRRGVKMEAIHFASPPYTSRQAQEKVVDLIKVLARFSGKIRLHIINFTKLQEKIYEVCDESYAVTIMRRMMYRIAETVAHNYKLLALVSGESIGQVASQTLNSMQVINRVISLPMIRPLATTDKNDIIAMAKQLGTYEISIRPFIDCCTIFDPKNPITKPRIARAEDLEKRFDYMTFIAECIAQMETIDIDENYESNTEDSQYF